MKYCIVWASYNDSSNSVEPLPPIKAIACFSKQEAASALREQLQSVIASREMVYGALGNADVRVLLIRVRGLPVVGSTLVSDGEFWAKA